MHAHESCTVKVVVCVLASCEYSLRLKRLQTRLIFIYEIFRNKDKRKVFMIARFITKNFVERTNN